ncbi:hypothetical protein [Pedobacter sp. MR2016-24]|uniref:hypothetical protein n=1 Tax=Pedobacter sp. MR2016-24 TaxID=2994466 RepID=UPI0022472D82|nr:hypothetical protein [Pedobacter sp. MR2016-24]MCX2486600.1 hypothetical protein [Pedobacter sp. MR2016-24]
MARPKAGLENKFDAKINAIKKQIEALQEDLATAEKHKAEFSEFKDKYEYYKQLEDAEAVISPIVKRRGITKTGTVVKPANTKLPKGVKFDKDDEAL